MRNLCLIITIALCSCKATKPVVTKTNEQIKERVVTIKELLHDTTLLVKPDSASITALLQCDSTGNVLLKQLQNYKQGVRIAPPMLSIKNNALTASCFFDTIKINTAFKERIVTDTATLCITKTDTVYKNYVTGWQWFQIWLGRILGMFLIAFIIWLYKK